MPFLPLPVAEPFSVKLGALGGGCSTGSRSGETLGNTFPYREILAKKAAL